MITVQSGTAPILLVLPHSGQRIQREIAARMTATALLQTDTSWHLEEVFAFAQELGITTLGSSTSRYVIDVDKSPSRSAMDLSDMMCPITTYDGMQIYQAGEVPGPIEIEERRRLYHEPFHDRLAREVARLRSLHDVVVVIDCQSIRSRIKGYYPGELPAVNIGTMGGRTCHEDVSFLLSTVEKGLAVGTSSENDVTRGGHIIATCGNPDEGVHAVSLLLAQRTYVRHEAPPFEIDKERLRQLRSALRGVFLQLADWTKGGHVLAPRATLLEPLPALI